MTLSDSTRVRVPIETNQRPITDEAPRCVNCERKLAAYMTRPWELICQRCNTLNSRS